MEDPLGKVKHQDNPFIEPSTQHTVVDMKGLYSHSKTEIDQR